MTMGITHMHTPLLHTTRTSVNLERKKIVVQNECLQDLFFKKWIIGSITAEVYKADHQF